MNAPRQRLTLSRIQITVLGAIALAFIAAVVIATTGGSPSRASSPTSSDASPRAAARTTAQVAAPAVAAADRLPTRPMSYLGVHEGDMPNSYALTTTFKRAVDTWPNVVLYYSGWPEKFQTQFAQTARSHGAVTLVDINPGTIPLTAISDGSQDWFIKAFADEVKAYGHPVLINFGHEMNGTWYPWGEPKSTPAQFVAAWRHIFNVFTAQKVSNATWVWIVNAFSNGSHPVAAWYPGNAYVNWAGIDSYIYTKQDTFANSFGKTLTQVRKVATGKPVFISEIAVGPVAGQAAKIPGVFAAIKQDHLLGLAWFDKNQGRGVKHQAWRLDNNTAAVKAFRNAMKKDDSPLAKVTGG